MSYKRKVQLYDHQLKALSKMHNGCILVGRVGSGKSRTALAYYVNNILGICQELGDGLLIVDVDSIREVKDLYVITTARKRDTKDWEEEAMPFNIVYNDECKVKVHVDSWNNIKKYVNIKGAFFIFDEQRVVGYGTWTHAFLQIVKNNEWILLSATPGDTWHDYMPVFIANGFYKNKSDFDANHAVYSRFSKFPKIERYVNVQKLIRLRNEILVDMPFKRETEQIHKYIKCEYDEDLYKVIFKDRWDPVEERPLRDAAECCLKLRKLVNLSSDRRRNLKVILSSHQKAIIFYNFDDELKILKDYLDHDKVPYAEWNGHKHELIPHTDIWAYLVQYQAGNEGWNCTETNCIIFYSQNYSYKVMTQAAGRIDRMNTPFKELYYYHLTSNSSIDRSIEYALRRKKSFNESKFISW